MSSSICNDYASCDVLQTPNKAVVMCISMCITGFQFIFRGYAMQALDKRSENDLEDQLRFMSVASQHCNAMRHVRSRHPATLQAISQVQLLCLDFDIMSGQPDLSQPDFDPDPM